MKLEVGKTYRARNGAIVKIIYKDDSCRFLYVGINRYYYRSDGHYHVTCDSERDLIEEVPDSLAAPELEEFHKWDTTIGQKQRREEDFEVGSVTLKNRMKEKPTVGHAVTVPQKVPEGPGASVTSGFKVGDKVFDILNGKTYVLEKTNHPIYYLGAGFTAFTVNGKQDISDKYPRFISLEEARAKGYNVPVQNVKKSRVVNVWYSPSTDEIYDGDVATPKDVVVKEVTFEWEEDEA
jgi:hypothetical protein